MSNIYKLWRLAAEKKELRQKLSEAFSIPEVIAQVLINRGLTEEAAVEKFLHTGMEDLLDPYLLKDMQKAVQRIVAAIDQKEKITIYGDYDVDGITSCALLYKFLNHVGAVVEYYIPERLTEGYGLNISALENIQKSGATLIITVDCGISSVSEVDAILGKIDIIITDHHQPPALLPKAWAIINPKQPDCLYPEKNLAGVGVGFKLCQALWQHYYGEDSAYIDTLAMVAIGTIADIVPLLGENRTLVKLGLKQLNQNPCIGLKALLDICGITGRADTGNIGFVLAPRLNAAGRINHATDGVELLLTQDTNRAQELAAILDEENIERQQVERKILDDAFQLLSQVDLSRNKVIVLAKENWHSGVIGIVASRLVEKYYRPVIMISIHDGLGKGSCRSIPGFDLYKALSRCAEVLVQFGGHRQAAGLTIKPENIERLRQGMNRFAAEELTEEDFLSVINVDSILPINEIDLAFVEQLATLAPFGMGNPSPNFACGSLLLTNARTIGQDGRHLKMQVKKDNTKNDVVAWNMGSLAESLKPKQAINLIFSPEINEWQGKKNIQLRARDLCDEAIDPEIRKVFNNLAPDRAVIAQIYLILKNAAVKDNGITVTNNQIMQEIRNLYHTDIAETGVEKSIRILSELDLLQVDAQGETRVIRLCPTPANKLDLMSSKTFCDGLERKKQYINIGGFFNEF